MSMGFEQFNIAKEKSLISYNFSSIKNLDNNSHL